MTSSLLEQLIAAKNNGTHAKPYSIVIILNKLSIPSILSSVSIACKVSTFSIVSLVSILLGIVRIFRI